MKKTLIFYYLILILLLSTWNSEDMPPFYLRMAYLVAVMIPLFGKRSPLFPCILSMFVTISANRFFPSYMPYMPEYLLVATLGVLLFVRQKTSVVVPNVLLLFLVVTFFVDLIHSYSVDSISFTLLTVILFYRFMDSDLKTRGVEMSWSFIIISAVLCIEILIHRGEITYTLTVGTQDFERIGWNDPNYFTGIIGMGALAALQMLVTTINLSKWQRYALIGILLLVFFVSLLVASRGGIAALMGGSVALLILSRRNNSRSSRLLLLLVVFGGILFSIGAFDMLLSRMANDEGELGGRTIIWVSKLTDFASSASPLDWLFGIGHKAAIATSSYVGNRSIIGFHNDYIAFLLSYGIVGLFLFVFLLVYPIIKFKDACVTAGIIYIALISFSLEPLSSGSLGYYYFYFFLNILGRSKDKFRIGVNEQKLNKHFIQ